MLVIHAHAKYLRAVPFDAFALDALTAPHLAPSEFVVAPTLDAQASEMVARAGISVAQVVTLATYTLIVLALVGAPVFIGVLWRRFRK